MTKDKNTMDDWIDGALPLWYNDKGEEVAPKWLEYGGICKHDDGWYCEHRHAYVKALITAKLQEVDRAARTSELEKTPNHTAINLYVRNRLAELKREQNDAAKS